MKALSLIALTGAFAAATPVAADVIHKTAVEQVGHTLSVTYEPRVRVSTRQSGLGPRGFTTCLWESRVSIERRIAGADGNAIEALTRTVGEGHTATGSQPGYCSHMPARRTAPFGGDAEKLRAFLALAAENDTQRLNAELASVRSLGRGMAR